MTTTTTKTPVLFPRIDEAVTHLLSTGRELKIATPLGLGKPNQLLNLLYDAVKRDPARRLTIFTALSLAPPEAGNDVARRFLGPFAARQWGDAYPVLEYARDARKGRLPPNVRVHEFYFQAGSALASPALQQDYQSINYTHVVARLVEEGVQAIVQLVARDRKPGSRRLSLSSNPDLTLDLVDGCRARGLPFRMIGVVHPDLPFLGGEAEVDEGFFDGLVEDPSLRQPLFGIPRSPVDETDHAIGFYASQLVLDDGTLQIGIGSLSDALVAGLVCRQRNPALYRRTKEASWQGHDLPRELTLSDAPFETGLYGLSEMVMDGFMHLRRAGILKRHVAGPEGGPGTYLDGAFYLGSTAFYDWLRSLEGDDRAGVRMGRISRVNQLYDPETFARRADRKRARFFNTCMQVTLLGGAASETLEDGKVVSGVGGQYNFVAMAHELPGARSVLMLRSARERGGRRCSNLVWSHGHLTIPRHLRDIVVTEYGIADLRGRTDQETIRALLAVTDAEFQPALVDMAKRSGKLDPRYELPAAARENTPERVRRWIADGRREGLFDPYPGGSDFTPEEERLAPALERLKAATSGPGARRRTARWLLASLGAETARFAPELERMQLLRPRGLRERMLRRLLLVALAGGP